MKVLMAHNNEKNLHLLEKKILDLEKANKALKQSEQRYRELVDKANCAVIVIEPTGYLSFVNPKFCEMMGYTMKKVKKLHFSKLVHPEELAMVTENFKKKLSGQQTPKSYKIRALTKRGDTIYVDYESSVIKRKGRMVGIQAVINDITARKKAEEEIKAKSQFLESLVEQSPLPTFVVDSEGIVVMVNKAFLKAYNVPTKEMVLGKNALTEPANVRQGVVKYIKEALSGKIIETPEIEFISPYQNKKTVTKSRLFPIFNTTNTLTNVVVMHEDITERKKMEDKEGQYFSDLAFLSKTAMELVEFTSNKDIYRYLGEQIRQLFPQSIKIHHQAPRNTKERASRDDLPHK